MKDADAAFDAIYARVPKIACKGLCATNCSLILLQQSEFERIGRAAYIKPTPNGSMTCPMLKNGRCSVYDVRPLICRLFGVVKVDTMRCQYGCKPERWLTHEEALALIEEARSISPRVRSLNTELDEVTRWQTKL